MESGATRGHVLPYPTVVKVWLMLIVLTAILVYVSEVYHEALSVAAMLTITPLKAGLVMYYFMHLKYEKPFLKSMVFVTLFILTLFIALTFLDLAYR